MPLQIRRGDTAEVNSITPLVGELIYNTQTGNVLVGDGNTPGGTPVAGISVNETKDAAAASLIAGTHKNISFSYNSTTKVLSATVDILTHETIVADAVDVAAVKDGSTIILDVANARLFGSVTGDVVGSVFADNSTLLVDAVSGTIPATVVSGTATINVIGNTTGYHTGDVKGSVFADDSSLIIDGLTGDVYANILHMGSAQVTQAGGVIDVPASTTIGGEPFRIRIGTEDSTITNFDMNDLVNIIGINGIQTTTEAGNITISSTGGLITPQSGETNSHYLMFIDTFNGGGRFKADGNLAYVPSTTTLNFLSGTINLTTVNAPNINTTAARTSSLASAGVLYLLSEFNSGGTDQFLISVGDPTDISKSSRLQVVSNSYFGAGISLAQFNQHHTTADALNVQFSRSRGTSVSPAAVQSGDDIVDLAFLGHDGSGYLARAAISATVNGAVSTGTVPLRIDIATSLNGAGNPVTAVSINDKQQTTFNGAITVKSYADASARDTAIPTPTAGMIIFNTGTGKFQGNVDGLTTGWQDFN